MKTYHGILVSLALACQCPGEDVPVRTEVPKEVREVARKLDAVHLLYPAPNHRFAAIKRFAKEKGAGDFCVLTEEDARELVGPGYSNADGRIPILVRWVYLEEEKVDLKYAQAGSAPPVVWIDGGMVHVQARNHDVSKKGRSVEYPIVLLVEKEPEKVILYSHTTGW